MYAQNITHFAIFIATYLIYIIMKTYFIGFNKHMDTKQT